MISLGLAGFGMRSMITCLGGGGGGGRIFSINVTDLATCGSAGALSLEIACMNLVISFHF
jgi:hypothetical protein